MWDANLYTEEDASKEVNKERSNDEEPDNLEQGSSKVYNSVVLDDPVTSFHFLGAIWIPRIIFLFQNTANYWNSTDPDILFIIFRDLKIS